MKTKILAVLLLLVLAACRKDQVEPNAPDYADWYALRSPDARAIRAVHGDLDGTLVITTGFQIYQTKDRGRTWQTSNYADNLGIFGFLSRPDTLLALTGGLGSAYDSVTTAYATHPTVFSLDEGLTWQRYRNWDRRPLEPQVALNRVTSAAGTEYRIDFRLTPISPPSTTSNYVETIGIRTSTGRQLTLPQQHQIESLYLDATSRLYVAASAALCGTLKEFAFCGEPNGILYVSKTAEP